ncbi:zinc finger protein [Macleaya cordata]|uniref:Zinc finger protein n=1 Tax=Macleaya cordata TaxID=56857 RepID=A0A200PR28_MACCD|nr:zinc finger protein [Macleaya cordata]
MRLGSSSERRAVNRPLRLCCGTHNTRQSGHGAGADGDGDGDNINTNTPTAESIKPKRRRPRESSNKGKGKGKGKGLESDGTTCQHHLRRIPCRSKPTSLKQDDSVKRNFVRADPSYLKTLGQTHSGWIFGAIAELVDNSRDAKATKIEISVESHYSKIAGEKIPMLSVIDDGHGMSHQEIMVMLSFGHKRSDAYDQDSIGRFGIGFKTGAMKLGRDVILLTQTSESRSIAFLSQSVNEDKDNLEIPVVTYSRQGSIMEVDRNIQSEASADYHLKAIKDFSPFNEYFIGEKLGLFGENGKGTQIYIWNLDKWGLDFTLEWQKRNGDNNTSNEDDILIRSRRTRSRQGQISQKVPLDYSLRSYLEVIYLDPRMKIFVQGSLVKSRPLAKSLNKTTVINGEIMGRHVQLILGRCQQEWEQLNCGIFLYWHGRLIEAYKRVGSMVHNADIGRGVIGVIDVTDLLRYGDDVWVHNTKQAFLDCEAYVKLEEWLGHKSDEYWDEHFDTLQLDKNKAHYKPDNEWVQCEKCRKWRMLSFGFDSTSLPQEWFCHMLPYNGECETPEEELEPDAVAVGAKRSRSHKKGKHVVSVSKVYSKKRLRVSQQV